VVKLKEIKMKTEIFQSAIKNRNRVKFLYGLDEIFIEPYYLTIEKNGSKVIYGKVFHSSEIRKFNFSKIANIKVLDKKRFSPIIPIIPLAS
jgi:predicted DNA-binding transcriptional regulator YafY